MVHTPAITRVSAHAFRFATDAPEADGTIAWDSTTMVLVEVEAGGEGIDHRPPRLPAAADAM